MFCIYCGKRVENRDRFCGSCGKKVFNQESKKTKPICQKQERNDESRKSQWPVNYESTNLVAKEIIRLTKKLGFKAQLFRSNCPNSDSVYVSIFYKNLRIEKKIRVSNHCVPPTRQERMSSFDFDVFGTKPRKGAISCYEVIAILAQSVSKSLPQELLYLHPYNYEKKHIQLVG